MTIIKRRKPLKTLETRRVWLPPTPVVPILASISPDLGDIYAGTPVTITGTRMSGVTSVKFGVTEATSVVAVSSTTVTCVAPAKAAGTYDVVCTNSEGDSNALSYEAWHPTTDYPAARVFQSDQGVTSAGSATRHRSGPLTQDWGFPVRDGAQIFTLASGRIISVGGWGATNAWGDGLDVTNEVLYSDDGGRTWAELQGHVTAPPTSGATARFLPGHTAGVIKHTVSSVDYIYWIGSDALVGAARDGGVWRALASNLDVGGTLSGCWERISTVAPTDLLSLMGVVSYNGNLYVMGGQVDLGSTASAINEVWRSTDHGVNWTQLSNGPWAARCNVYGLCVYDGLIYLVGGARYHPVWATRVFYNDVWTFDDTGDVWTEVLADGHVQWTGRHYHQTVVWNNKLWIIDGYEPPPGVDGNTAEAYSTTDGATWTAVDSAFITWAATHAQGVTITSEGLLRTEGVTGSRTYLLDENTGALVSAWADRGSGALTLSQGTDANKPILALANLGTMPGIVMTGAQTMALGLHDREITGGVLEEYIVGKSLNTTSEGGFSMPTSTIIGTTNGSAYNQFGLNGTGLAYYDAELAKDVRGGSGLTDNVTRLLGVEHQASSLKLYASGAQVGSTDTTVGFNATWTGVDCIGAALGTTNYAKATVGAIIWIKLAAPTSATFRGKLLKWAGKWGAEQ